MNIIPPAFDSDCITQPDQSHLSSAVIRLTKVTVQSGIGRGHYDTTVILFLKYRESSLRRFETPF